MSEYEGYERIMSAYVGKPSKCIPPASLALTQAIQCWLSSASVDLPKTSC